MSHTAVTKVIARYEREGAAGLAPRKRGRRSGEDRALTAEQEDAVRRIICDKRPEQLKMEFALWSRAAVMQLIERECGVKLHVRSVGKYLARKIELFYLPSYSPELNPEERLNADLKQAIGSKVPARTKAKLKTATTAHMTRLEQTPDRVMSYFQEPHVRYAA